MRSSPGSRLAVVGLLAGNAIPLVGVAFFGWGVPALMLVYWLESAVVGVGSVAKILRAAGEDDPAELPEMSFNDRSVASFVGRSKRSVAGFFVQHYGVFWLVHGVFVLTVFRGFAPLVDGEWASVVIPTVGFVGYHALSYRLNFVGYGEFERSGPVTLMVEPYRRVLVLHLTIVLGAFAVGGVGAPVGAVAVMVLVKTVLDLRGHWRAHDRANRRSSSTTATGVE
ncbi:DUF6498-containing protein [Halorubellus litoreus]|uniref:DUF6498-containing protein n=1 Tax=Halorubellus litoreus TaxID=755308 RepID=A0ABD5VFV7_9EURY